MAILVTSRRARNNRTLLSLASFLIILTLWVCMKETDISPLLTSHASQALQSADIFDFAPLDSQAVKSLCLQTRWNENLVFTCNDSGGGVGNLRNSILNCVRYAISAGSAMTLPKVQLRDPHNIAKIWDRERVPFSYIFDEPHFVESLRLSCPQLQIFESVEEFPKYNTSSGPYRLNPEKIGGNMTPEGLEHPEDWRNYFYKWLLTAVEYKKPAVVDLERSYLQYPIYSDSEEFALDIGGILKFRTDARELATTAIKNLVKTYNINSDFRTPIWENSFFGVHLRTEIDSQRGWPVAEFEFSKYEVQSENYLAQAAASGTSVIYLASGDRTQVTRFVVDAASRNLTVTTKLDLLTGTDREKLDALSFDQQALIDYLVLLKSSGFAGVGHSSFAWNIALWRHKFAKQRDHLHGPQIMNDELSQILGDVNQYPEYACCLWP